MKIPKNFNTYCPSCKTHTPHVVERVKKGQASTLTRIVRQKARHTGIGNSGKFS
ncbi:MAG: 50S ribosomal protein L44e, partial [Candidatus Methanoperedens sp.]|nr:50S ribosomal protein L44e [Candidatus Methanoperedens sp.]